MKNCSIENCENKYAAKGFCQKHYNNNKNHGDPLAGTYSQNKAGSKEYISENSEIDINGCWLWKRYKNNAGYGQSDFKGKHILAHRLSYLTFVGKIPNNLHVLHNCDNPACVNPKHLFLGTHQDNMNDKVNKNRQASKVNKKEVDEIRTLYSVELAERAKGKDFQLTQKELAKRFRVSQTEINHIVNNKIWRKL
jgi:ribosomal protein L31E